MKNCCGISSGSISAHFDEITAENELKRYIQEGPNPTTRSLLAHIINTGTGTTLLDIGAGIGTASFELLAAGYTEAVCIDISPAYTAVTRKEIIKRGLENRMKMIEGDFAESNEGVPDSDTVIMDRVVCCYPSFRPLLESALQHSQRLFAYSYPNDRWYTRLVFAIENLLHKIRGEEFRTFIHSPREMERIITSAGFRKLKRTRTLVWSIDLFHRVAASASG
jgi:magnesium-protoporphyrin O-methyltransferase